MEELSGKSKRADRLLKSKLKTLARTIRIRGVECVRSQFENDTYSLVHGVNNIDVDGDYNTDTKDTKVILVININDLEKYQDKSQPDQEVLSNTDVLDKGDVVTFTGRRYKYRWTVIDKESYGDTERLYSYILQHLKTIRHE